MLLFPFQRQPLEPFILSPIYLNFIRNTHQLPSLTTHITITMYRQAIARQARLFSTSPRVRKSVIDQAKEAIKTVDKGVAQTIVKGIEKGGKWFA